MYERRRLTAQRKDESRMKDDKITVTRNDLRVKILHSLIRERDRRRTALCRLDSASSFAISNFSRAPREARDAHAYTVQAGTTSCEYV